MKKQNLSPVEFYFKRFGYQSRYFSPQPNPALRLVIVIPCYNEPNVVQSLIALDNCDYENKNEVEVIVVINSSNEVPAEVKKQNELSIEEIKHYKSIRKSGFKIDVIIAQDLPRKHAGVGLARKIGMDEAIHRFNDIDNNKGVIVCFDADSLCDPNFLKEVNSFFTENPNFNACSIHFEHPLEGKSFSNETFDAITKYELHLRYFINIQKWTDFPHAYQTIGSSMAVRADAYVKEGGMNKRKAGEDFYFLHKVIPLGGFGEIKNTKTIPSPRRSDRVPFGTGKAVNDILDGETEYLTYSPQSFVLLKALFAKVQTLFIKNDFDFPEPLYEFLKTQDFEENLASIRKHSKTIEVFENHFYRWFNGFMIMKYAHFMRDNYYPNIKLIDAVNELFRFTNEPTYNTEKEQLIALRVIDLR